MANMADDLPSEFDVIVVGTGLPESILAAALSRIGQTVLHVDRNDYYSGRWASFNFQGIDSWVERATKGDPELKHPDNPPSLDDGEHSVQLRLLDNSFSQIESKFCVREKEPDPPEVTEEPKGSEKDVNNTENTDTVKGESVEQSDDQQSTEQSREQNTEDSKEEVKDQEKEQTGQDNTSIASDVKTTTKEWTQESLKKEWRKFNLDISPKLVYCAGSMVELLISSDIAKYCEFKTVTRILTLLEDKLEKVPCSRADVFSSKQVSMLDKRMLMKLLSFCTDYESHPEEYQDFAEKPFVEFLKSKKLSKNVFHFVQHSIAMATDSMTTLEGLASTKKFLHSLGRYGNTAFLWSLYGSGELPQSFCRMCAVFGGIYCLRMSASSVILDAENKCKGIVLTSGQKIKCKHLIIEESYLPEDFIEVQKKSYVHRAILVTDQSILLTEDQQLSLMNIPDPADGNRPTSLIELQSSSMACPKALNVVHLTRKSQSRETTPQEDLQYVVSKLFTEANIDTEDEEKPKILWSLYYKQQYSESLSPGTIAPENMIILPGPGPEIDLDWVVEQTRSIFQKLMPEEEFLPRPPNPEDIIYVDENEEKVGDNSDQSGFGTESGEEKCGNELNDENKGENSKTEIDQSKIVEQTDKQEVESENSEEVKNQSKDSS